MKTITVYFILAIFLSPVMKLLVRLKNIILLIRWKNRDLIRFHQGIIEIEDLHRLTPREFEEWCGEFLAKSGYTDVQLTPFDSDGGKDIICKYGDDTVYVECKRYSPVISAPFKVHADIVKKLTGAMVHDGVNKGLIITTGIVTKSAWLYAKTITAPYTVQIIDGSLLVKKCLEHKLYNAMGQG